MEMKEAAEILGLSAVDISRVTGIKVHRVRGILAGRKKLFRPKLEEIEAVFQVMEMAFARDRSRICIEHEDRIKELNRLSNAFLGKLPADRLRELEEKR